jgi:hypothetical protein
MTRFENDTRHDDGPDTWMPPVAFGGDEPLTLAELRAIDEGSLTVPEARITDEDREEMGWPTESDRQEMEAWRTVAALETALSRLETGELLSDCNDEIIAIKRGEGKGFGIWAVGQVTSTDVPTAREAAELLGGVR